MQVSLQVFCFKRYEEVVEHDKQFQVIKNEDLRYKVKTMFIIGNPEDTKETIIQSIEYAKYLPIVLTI